MDSGHSNEARWPNNTLLTYTLPRTVKVRESVDVQQMRSDPQNLNALAEK